MKTLKELRAEMLALSKKLDDLGKIPTPSEDQYKEMDAGLIEYEGLKEELNRAEGLESARRTGTQLAASAGRASGVVTEEMQRQLDEGRETQASRRNDPRSISERFIASEGWEEFRDSGFRKGLNSGSVEVESFFHRHRADAGAHQEGMSAEETYALVATGAFPSNPALIAPLRVPGIYTQDLPETNVRSVFQNFQTNSPVIQFFRQLVWTRAAAFVAEATATSGSSGLKPEAGVTFESDSVTAEVLAAWMPATNQTLEDEPQMRGIIEGLLIDDLRLTEDDVLLNGSGSAPEIEGLLNVTGVQLLDDTYFGLLPVENAGTAWEDFDRITRGRTEVRITGRARGTATLLSPADMERLITITDNNGQYYSGSPFSDLAITRMRGLAVVETEALEEGTAVVLDGRKFAVFDRMQAAVTAGWIDQQFVRNMITLLAEERLAFAPFRPAAAAIVTLTSA